MCRMKLSDRCRDTTMTVRMTTEEKNRIKKKAEKEGKTASTYVTDAAMAGLERKSSKIKKSVSQMVQNQECLNEIFEKMKEMDIPDTNELYEKVIELMEGENRLWECLCK